MNLRRTTGSDTGALLVSDRGQHPTADLRAQEAPGYTSCRIGALPVRSYRVLSPELGLALGPELGLASGEAQR